MAGLAAVALIAAFLVQNLAELRGGGPPLPIFLRSLSRRRADLVRLRAVAMVSLVVSVFLVAVLAIGWRPGATMVAAALAANALIQSGQSLWQRRWLPGGLTGALLMLPAAIWLLVALGPVPAWQVWAALGVIAMPPVLLMVWVLAARRRRRG